jgi:surface protein
MELNFLSNHQTLKTHTMKKQYIIFSFFAALLAVSVVSCKKDQDVVTLNAVIQKVSNDSKVYINDHTPYWHNGDQIRINDADYTLQTAMENSAQIPNVANSTLGYRAIFPAGVLTNSNDNINNSSSVAVTLPATQVFEMVGTHQRVDVPMGAFIDRGSTLQFHNLCSLVRVYVSNAINAQLPVTNITITAESVTLSGMGTATITGESSDAIVIPSSTGSHSVSLCKTDNTPMKTVEPLATEYFDVIVPEFSTPSDVTVTVTTTTGYKSIPIEDATLAHNTITTVTVNVDELSQTAAELVSGPTFNAAIPQNATAIRFEYNNAAVTSGTILSTSSSQYPIYGNMDGSTWVVSTPANRMNANSYCFRMFRGLYANLSLALTNIEFGDNFNTSNVINMSEMFYGCNSMTSIDLSNFNTSNVTNMSGLFGYCSTLTSLNLSSFNTTNVTNMKQMFIHCSSLTSLNLSNFNTFNVTNMTNMFFDCSSLTSLNLSSFNTTNVTNMSQMFGRCSSLTSLNLSNFNTSNVTNMYWMFGGCSSLTSLNLSNFNTSNVTNMYGMFGDCSNLTSIDLYNFNTANVNDMRYMFQNCSRLTSLNLYNFDMNGLTSHDGYTGKYAMCSGLASISGACAITCPTSIQVEFQSGTSLVNSRITWYTH